MSGFWRYMALFAALLQDALIGQNSAPLSFYSYQNYRDNQGVILGFSTGGCDSLRLFDFRGKRVPTADVTCFPIDTLNGEPLKIATLSGVDFLLDGVGNVYARDVEATKPRIFVSDPPSKLPEMPLVVEYFETPDGKLDVCYSGLKNYRLGAKKPPQTQCIRLSVDDIVLSATGRLSETKRLELAEKITFYPEDRKVMDTLIVNIPTEGLPHDLRLFGFIYDMKGNVIRLQIGLRPGQNLIFRETILPGTYKLYIMLDEQTELMRKLIFMQDPPRLHEQD